MALPDGITTTTFTAGPVVDMQGEPADITVEVTTVLGKPDYITHKSGTVAVAGTATAGVDTIRPVAITGLNGGLPSISNYKNTAGLINLR